MVKLYDRGTEVPTGSHGEHDLLFASGEPVQDAGESTLAFERGTGLGGKTGMRLYFELDDLSGNTVSAEGIDDNSDGGEFVEDGDVTLSYSLKAAGGEFSVDYLRSDGASIDEFDDGVIDSAWDISAGGKTYFEERNGALITGFNGDDGEDGAFIESRRGWGLPIYPEVGEQVTLTVTLPDREDLNFQFLVGDNSTSPKSLYSFAFFPLDGSIQVIKYTPDTYRTIAYNTTTFDPGTYKFTCLREWV